MFSSLAIFAGRSYNTLACNTLARRAGQRYLESRLMTAETFKEPLPRGVWALGITSLFMDTSSELIHGLLPVFLMVTLGASATALGLVEGIAESTAQVTRVFSGWLSDALGKRKALTIAGYGLAAATKPLFPLANSIGLVLLARFLDRIGKGIRGAPRDALVADLTPPEQRGAAFGLRQSLDTVGATLGPAAAIVLMYLFNDDIRTVLWFAVIPAVLAVVVLVFGVKEPEHLEQKPKAPLRMHDIKELGSAYWLVIVAGTVFTLARFSEAFLVIRAKDGGLPLAWAPAVIAAMSLVFALSASPAGRFQDKIGARPLLLFGLVVLIAADLLLGWGSSLVVIFLGIGLWGLHMGLTQGVLAALIAATAPERLRGTAFGLFGLITGVAALIASVLAGLLWDRIGADATFSAGAAFAAIAFVAFLVAKQGPTSRAGSRG
jgi:MFS family permease